MTISNPTRLDDRLSQQLFRDINRSARWHAQALAADLQQGLPTVDATTSSQDLMAFFAVHTAQAAVVVVDRDRPVGLIDKARFLMEYLPQRGTRDAANLSCLNWLAPRIMVVDALASVPEILLRGYAEKATPQADGFIVTEHGRYLGLVCGLALRTAVLDLETEAQRERLDGMAFAMPMQQHLRFVSHEHLAYGVDDHGVLHQSEEPVSASGLFVRNFEGGTLAVVLEGTSQGRPCYKTHVAAQLWMDAYEQPQEDAGGEIDPGQWLQRLHGHLLRDARKRDADAGIDSEPLIPWRLEDGLKAAALWLPRGGRRLRFAGSRMDLLLSRPGSRESRVLRGSLDLLGNASAADGATWAAQEVPLSAVHRALVVTSGVAEQRGGPFVEPLGLAMLSGFLRAHSTLNARDIGPMLATFVKDWRGTNLGPEDLTALVLSVGGSR